MKILVTGANGFVGRYLTEALNARGDTVIGVDIGAQGVFPFKTYYCCNLTDREQIFRILAEEQPEAIIHLAAVSSVSQSWQAPVESFVNNTNIFLNVVEAVRMLKMKARILSIGSSEEYGNCPPEELPLTEEHRLAPCSPYAVARVSQELLSKLYCQGYRLDIVMTRSYNQIGPHQRTNFVVPSFVKQLQDGKNAGLDMVTVTTGDLSIVRDFLDVRDAVSAYVALLEKGIAGEVYNVCSGKGHTLREVLQTIAEIVGVQLKTVTDPTRIRPADNQAIIGDNTKLRALGWEPCHDLEATIRDMLSV